MARTTQEAAKQASASFSVFSLKKRMLTCLLAINQATRLILSRRQQHLSSDRITFSSRCIKFSLNIFAFF